MVSVGLAAPCVMDLEPTATRRIARHLVNGNGADRWAGFIE